MVLNYRIHGDSVNETETKLIFVALFDEMILFAMTWLISRSTVPILSELPTSLYDDASNGYHAST